MKTLVTVLLAGSAMVACSSTDPGPGVPSPTPTQQLEEKPPMVLLDKRAEPTPPELDPKVEMDRLSGYRPMDPKADTSNPEQVTFCGKNLCGADEYCCNESCGICAPANGSCTQQKCN